MSSRERRRFLVERLAAAALALAALPSPAAAPRVDAAAPDDRQGRWIVRFDPAVVRAGATAADVRVSGCDADAEIPGQPVLPAFGLTVPVPDGRTVARVRVLPGEPYTIALRQPVRWGQQAVPLSRAAAARLPPARPDPSVYSRDTVFPDPARPRFRVDRRDGRAELVVTLHPVQYRPLSRRLAGYRSVTLVAEWADSRVPGGPRPAGDGAPAAAGAAGAPAARAAATSLSAGSYDYVVISSSNLLATTPGPWNFAALCAARETAGLRTAQVSVEWIYAHYTGRDNPERIRNFVIDAHRTWGTRFLLLGGAACNPTVVPARLLYLQYQGGPTLYVENIPSDMYYGCLDGTFNDDGDDRYGEIGDGEGGGEVDLAAEVYVGRFPVTSTGEVSRMVSKTLLYEAAPTSDLARVSHVGEHLGFGGVADYATADMEQIRLGGLYDTYATLGFENSPYAAFYNTDNTLYDTEGYRWPTAEILQRFNSGLSVFNHLGHGAPYYCFKLDLSDPGLAAAIAGLTNRLGFLAYSQACDTGRFDDHADCFAEQLVTSRGGAFAAVMNSRYGWGYAYSTDGPSQRFHRHFWDEVFAGRAYQLGVINQLAKESLRYQVNASMGEPMRWCYYELTLFGDPATPYAARLLNLPPSFAHTPLSNRWTTNGAYAVEAEIGPVGLLDVSTPALVWSVDGAPGGATTDLMVRVAGSLFAGAIPAQPFGARVRYAMMAATLAGVRGQWPAAGTQTFDVMPPLTLDVQGEPEPWGDVTPPYGANAIASNTPVSASAPARDVVPGGVSHRCLGWSGTGSVPEEGTNAAVSFVMDADSALTWHWETEYALSHTGSVQNLFGETPWYLPGSVATSTVVPDVTYRMGRSYSFAGWYLDGLRQPAAPGRAVNPVAGIAMTTSRVVYALFLATTNDLDANGLPDWWEYRYFGTNGASGALDPDGDGFPTSAEYDDRTDPLDFWSRPEAPGIVHAPLASPQSVPPPYPIAATITDSCAVAGATLRWNRNGSGWQTAAMAAGAGSLFTGIIPAPGQPRDGFDYAIEAVDPAGHVRTSATWHVDLQYPCVAALPTGGCTVVARSGSVVERLLTITNSGNGTLGWSLARGTRQSLLDTNTFGWNTNAMGQPWRIATARAASPPYSFYAHLTSAGGYSSPSVHGCLDSPPLALGTGARLFFQHWIASELDTSANGAGYAYDGGIVEISTNGGVSFQQLAGPYNYRIQGWTYSPWPHNTPCLAGNGSAGWNEAIFDLSAFAGCTATIRFHYGGDNNTDMEGWYVDDVRVGPVTSPPWPTWLTCPTAGYVAPSGASLLTMRHDAALAPSRDERLPLHILSNDPVTPNAYLDWRLLVRDPPEIVSLTAAQTSSNGEGTVTVTLDVANRDGDPSDLAFAFAEGGAGPWRLPSLGSPQAAFGPVCLNASAACVTGLASSVGGTARTNRLSLAWATLAAVPPPVLATGALVRVSASNAWFAAEPRDTAPFLVDNQAPATPVPGSATPAPGVWSADATLRISWPVCSDGAGCGGVRYRYGTGPSPDPSGGPLTNATSLALRLPDGDGTWFAVQAIDARGNASTAAFAGPFRIDTVPPSGTGAVVHVDASAYGPYTVGPSVTLRWDGFTDATSGIAGYYALYLTSLGFSYPVYTADLEAAFAVDNLDATNRFAVFALDRAGNVGSLATAPAWVLSPNGDLDGDGFTADQEELAGTDASRRESRFCVELADANGRSGCVVRVTWDSQPGRRYTLYRSAGLAPAYWLPVPGFADQPGQSGRLTNAVPAAGAGFLRVGIAPGP